MSICLIQKTYKYLVLCVFVYDTFHNRMATHLNAISFTVLLVWCILVMNSDPTPFHTPEGTSTLLKCALEIGMTLVHIAQVPFSFVLFLWLPPWQPIKIFKSMLCCRRCCSCGWRGFFLSSAHVNDFHLSSTIPMYCAQLLFVILLKVRLLVANLKNSRHTPSFLGGFSLNVRKLQLQLQTRFIQTCKVLMHWPRISYEFHMKRVF